MWIGRLRREMKELNREVEMAATEEERAAFELTRSTRDFTRRARAVADDKLAFSATLMRAGEVGAANRLLEDLERDVRVEEAALTEQVNEVKVATAARRANMTRLRLARTLAAAMLSAGLLAFSAAGMAVALFLADLEEGRGGGASGRSSVTALALSELGVENARGITTIRLLDGTRLMLNEHQVRTLENLTADGDLGRRELERLLLDIVGSRIAGQLADVLVGLAQEVTRATGEVTDRAGGAPASVTEELESAAPSVGAGAKHVGSRAKHVGSKPKSAADKPSPKASKSGGEEPVEKPKEPAEVHAEEPDDDGDIIDTPLDGGTPDQPEGHNDQEPALP